jgi:hypothetical protein
MAKNYDVDLNIAKKLDKSTHKIDRRDELVVTSVIAIGRELLKIKDLLPHGMFRPFVDNEFSFSFRLGEMRMNCVPFADRNPDIIDRIPLTVLYKFVAPRTPDSIRDRVCADVKVKAGQECPSLEELKLMIKQAREASLPAREANISGGEPDLNFSLEIEAPPENRGFELSADGSELLSMFIGNIPREELGAAARLLGTLCYTDLEKIVSKIRFKALRPEQLSRPDAEMEANCAFGA